MSDISYHLEAYVDILHQLEEKLDISIEDLQKIIHLVAVASGDLPQRSAEFLLCLATVCPSLKLS